MRLSEQQSDFFWMVVDLGNFAKKLFNDDGIYLKVQQWNRTLEEQRKLYDRGLTKTLRSKHLNDLAVDFQLMKNGQPIYESPIYAQLGGYWKSIGGVWGGDWRMPNGDYDVYHFEYNLKKRLEYRRARDG